MQTELKIELIKKIINARLTATEFSAVKDKAQEILSRRLLRSPKTK